MTTRYIINNWLEVLTEDGDHIGSCYTNDDGQAEVQFFDAKHCVEDMVFCYYISVDRGAMQ